MGVSEKRQNFHFGVEYSYKDSRINSFIIVFNNGFSVLNKSAD